MSSRAPVTVHVINITGAEVRKMKKAMIVLLVASACFSPVVQAEKLAGKNYISGSVGAWKFGDDFLGYQVASRLDD